MIVRDRITAPPPNPVSCLLANRRLGVRTGPTSRLDSDIRSLTALRIRCVVAEVSFSRLHRYMGRQKLNLI